MRNWMLRTGIVLLGTVLLSLAGGLPALADPATVDLERRNDAVNGAVGSTVFVHAHLTPKVKIQCLANGGYFYQSGGGEVDNDYDHWLAIRIVSAVTAPGLTRSTCVPGLCVDPNGGNNSALIVINGVRAKITPTPSPKPKPKPTTAAPAATTPATTPAATPTPALTFVAEPDPTGETPSTVEAVPAAHGSPLGLLAGIGGGIVVLAVVGALAVLRLRRPSP